MMNEHCFGAVITDGLVSNIIILASPDHASAFNVVLCPEEAQIGWSYVSGVFSPPDVDPVETPLEMPDISDRQFAEGIWREGLISYEDFLGFIGPGTIPPTLQAIIDQLPDDETGAPTDRKLAQGRVTGATFYRFSDPLVEMMRSFLAQSDPTWTPEYLQDRWIFWSTL